MFLLLRERKNMEDNGNSQALSRAVRALTEATQTLTSTAQALQTGVSVGQPIAGAEQLAAATQINRFEDDPFSEAVPTTNPSLAPRITVSPVANNFPLLQITITTAPPKPPGKYNPNTPEFLYWQASDELIRGINFWGPLLPQGTKWSTLQSPMRVTLVAPGQTLNAFYSRNNGLNFFLQTVKNVPIYSVQSPDVGCHELGHAILDAVRPQLFNAALVEAGALHESFGDMSAVLCALQLRTERQKVLTETQGTVNRSSRVSRLAEQLGWGIRQNSPASVEPDCLRNAANKWCYQPPEQLPPSGPATQLTREVHNFSRIFTGAFLDALAGMLLTHGHPNEHHLLAVSRALGQLLIDGVRTAPVVSKYFSQVAAAMIQADKVRNHGRYRNALSSAFVRHCILSPTGVADLTEAQVPQLQAVENEANGTQMLLTYDGEDDAYRRGGADLPEPSTVSVSTDFSSLPIIVEVGEPQAEPFAVAGEAPGSEDEARLFVEDLLRRGAIAFEPAEVGIASELGPPPTEEEDHITHVL